MTTAFGMAQDPVISNCAQCEQRVEHTDKFVVDREIIHKDCFKCSLCGNRLQVGFCAMETSFYNRYGPRWYCSLLCAHQPLGVKEAKLKDQGVQVRQPKTKKAN